MLFPQSQENFFQYKLINLYNFLGKNHTKFLIYLNFLRKIVKKN